MRPIVRKRKVTLAHCFHTKHASWICQLIIELLWKALRQLKNTASYQTNGDSAPAQNLFDAFSLHTEYHPHPKQLNFDAWTTQR